MTSQTDDKLTKGTLVVVHPQSYPMQRWAGRIERRTPNGYRVRYECNGVEFTSSFSEREIKARA